MRKLLRSAVLILTSAMMLTGCKVNADAYDCGQEPADALEYSVSFEPDEFGGFLQVSGMTFDVDLGVKSQVKVDEDGMFTGFSGDERRVKYPDRR